MRSPDLPGGLGKIKRTSSFTAVSSTDHSNNSSGSGVNVPARRGSGVSFEQPHQQHSKPSSSSSHTTPTLQPVRIRAGSLVDIPPALSSPTSQSGNSGGDLHTPRDAALLGGVIGSGGHQQQTPPTGATNNAADADGGGGGEGYESCWIDSLAVSVSNTFPWIINVHRHSEVERAKRFVLFTNMLTGLLGGLPLAVCLIVDMTSAGTTGGGANSEIASLVALLLMFIIPTALWIIINIATGSSSSSSGGEDGNNNNNNASASSSSSVKVSPVAVDISTISVLCLCLWVGVCWTGAAFVCFVMLSTVFLCATTVETSDMVRNLVHVPLVLGGGVYLLVKAAEESSLLSAGTGAVPTSFAFALSSSSAGSIVALVVSILHACIFVGASLVFRSMQLVGAAGGASSHRNGNPSSFLYNKNNNNNNNILATSGFDPISTKIIHALLRHDIKAAKKHAGVTTSSAGGGPPAGITRAGSGLRGRGGGGSSANLGTSGTGPTTAAGSHVSREESTISAASSAGGHSDEGATAPKTVAVITLGKLVQIIEQYLSFVPSWVLSSHKHGHRDSDAEETLEDSDLSQEETWTDSGTNATATPRGSASGSGGFGGRKGGGGGSVKGSFRRRPGASDDDAFDPVNHLPGFVPDDGSSNAASPADGVMFGEFDVTDANADDNQELDTVGGGAGGGGSGGASREHSGATGSGTMSQQASGTFASLSPVYSGVGTPAGLEGFAGKVSVCVVHYELDFARYSLAFNEAKMSASAVAKKRRMSSFEGIPISKSEGEFAVTSGDVLAGAAVAAASSSPNNNDRNNNNKSPDPVAREGSNLSSNSGGNNSNNNPHNSHDPTQSEVEKIIIDSMCDMVGNTGGTIHSVVAGTVIVSWNALNRVASPEHKAVKFLNSAHALIKSDEFPGLTVAGAVMTGYGRSLISNSGPVVTSVISVRWWRELETMVLLARQQGVILIDLATKHAVFFDYALRGVGCVRTALRFSDKQKKRGSGGGGGAAVASTLDRSSSGKNLNTNANDNNNNDQDDDNEQSSSRKKRADSSPSVQALKRRLSQIDPELLQKAVAGRRKHNSSSSSSSNGPNSPKGATTDTTNNNNNKDGAGEDDSAATLPEQILRHHSSLKWAKGLATGLLPIFAVLSKRATTGGGHNVEWMYMLQDGKSETAVGGTDPNAVSCNALDHAAGGNFQKAKQEIDQAVGLCEKLKQTLEVRRSERFAASFAGGSSSGNSKGGGGGGGSADPASPFSPSASPTLRQQAELDALDLQMEINEESLEAFKELSIRLSEKGSRDEFPYSIVVQ